MSFIKKRGKKEIYAYFWYDAGVGTTRVKSLKTTDHQTAKAKQKIEDGKHAQKQFLPSRRSFDDFIKEFLEYATPPRKAPASYAKDKEVLNAFKAFAKPRHTEQVTSQKIEQYLASVAKDSSAGNSNTHYRHLKAAIRQGRKWGYFGLQTPIDNVKPFRVTKKIKQPLTWEELGRLYGAAQADKNPRAYLMALWFTGTGCRMSELCTTKDVDVRADLGLWKIVETKERKEKLIPLPTRVVEEYRRHEPDPSGYVFAGGNGKPISRFTVYWTFRRLFKDAEIANTKVHLLRDTFITSGQFEWEIPMGVIKDWVGHSSITVTEGYTHANIDHLQRFAKAIFLPQPVAKPVVKP